MNKEEIKKYFDKPEKVGILKYRIDNGRVVIDGVSEDLRIDEKNYTLLFILIGFLRNSL